MAVAQAGSCSSDSTSSLRTSIWFKSGQKKKKEGRKKERKRERKKNGVNLQGLNYKTDENQEAMAPEYHRGREELCKWHNIILEQTMPFLPLESHPLKEERQ